MLSFQIYYLNTKKRTTSHIYVKVLYVVLPDILPKLKTKGRSQNPPIIKVHKKYGGDFGSFP